MLRARRATHAAYRGLAPLGYIHSGAKTGAASRQEAARGHEGAHATDKNTPVSNCHQEEPQSMSAPLRSEIKPGRGKVALQPGHSQLVRSAPSPCQGAGGAAL